MIISRNELKKLIDLKGDYVLIDVRNTDELANGMIPSAKNIPLSKIEHAFDMDEDEFKETYGFSKFTKKDNLIFHCRTGGRSEMATQIALGKGYNARNYAGSIWEWAEIDKNVKRYGPMPG